MEQKMAHRAIRKIAEREGVSEAQVIADMKKAMEEMKHDAYAFGDTRKITFWESLPHEGKEPTVYDFVTFLSNFTYNMR